MTFSETGGVFTTLDVPGATHTLALGIDGDSIVGIYATGLNGYPARDAFIESGGIYTTIDIPGVIETEATGISNSSIAGTFVDATGDHGYVETGSGFTSFDVPGAKYTFARGIFDNTVVGGYLDVDNIQHGFVTTVDVVPEPASLGMLGIGVIAVATWRRRPSITRH